MTYFFFGICSNHILKTRNDKFKETGASWKVAIMVVVACGVELLRTVQQLLIFWVECFIKRICLLAPLLFVITYSDISIYYMLFHSKQIK